MQCKLCGQNTITPVGTCMNKECPINKSTHGWVSTIVCMECGITGKIAPARDVKTEIRSTCPKCNKSTMHIIFEKEPYVEPLPKRQATCTSCCSFFFYPDPLKFYNPAICCNKRHWEIKSAKNIMEFRQFLKKAEACPDYEKAQDDAETNKENL